MYVPDYPTFRCRWLATPATESSSLSDDRWIPSGRREVFAYAKSGLAAALSGLPSSGRGTALVPTFIPGGVVWAMKRAGFAVRYYPVNADLTLPAESIRERIAAVDPDVVLFVHYFGFVADGYSALAAAARSAGAVVVEDCARGLFGRAPDGALLGSTGDISLFCLHKTLPIPNGGLVRTRQTPLPTPSRSRRELRSALTAGVHRLSQLLGVRPTLTRPTVTVPTDCSLESVRPPPTGGPEYGIGPLSKRGLLRCDPLQIRTARRSRYDRLRASLVDIDGVEVLTPPSHEGACPYGVSISVADSRTRNRLYESLYRRHLPAQIFAWPYVRSVPANRDAEGGTALRSRMLVLPTHQQIPPAAVDRIADCVAGELS
ncbi:DegT/DnrJ/EryC1/StrS family aminotransferase (plasmid) [Haloferacaceae archaeon DSL9]